MQEKGLEQKQKRRNSRTWISVWSLNSITLRRCSNYSILCGRSLHQFLHIRASLYSLYNLVYWLNIKFEATGIWSVLLLSHPNFMRKLYAFNRVRVCGWISFNFIPIISNNKLLFFLIVQILFICSTLILTFMSLCTTWVVWIVMDLQFWDLGTYKVHVNEKNISNHMLA